VSGATVPGAKAPLVVAVAVCCIAAAHTVDAQTTAQIPLQFDFQTPGARAMAMGGAFIGAADDSSAAFTSPGGLGFLTAAGKQELDAEGRFTSDETPFLAAGRISGVVTGRGFDTVAGPVYREDVDREAQLGYLSYLAPVKRVVVAAYRHQMVAIENSFFDEGVFERFTFAGITDDNNREIPIGGTRRVNVSSYGGTLGWKITEHVGIGGGLSIDHFTLESDFARFGFVSSIFGDVNRSIQSATATQTGHDVSVAWNAGILVKPTDRFQAAATFRRGPRFGFSQEDRVVGDPRFPLTRTGDFKVPDVAGAGIAWRAGENLRIVADYDYVAYDQLRHDFIDFQAISSGRQDQIRIDNANEIHGGAEYQWLRSAGPVLAFRGGAWFDPAHAPRYVSTPQHDELDVLLSTALPGGKDLVHYTFGAGAVFANVEINGAVDRSSRTTAATVSTVVRF
jgi:long-chain fatty acid transport protein